MKQLPKVPQTKDAQTVVGVITNSDDRVPGVLTSLSLRVSPLRFGHDLVSKSVTGEVYDIDFSVMSYDVGYEKPDKRIFEAAEQMLKTSLDGAIDPSTWQKVYVGDDYEKDIVGAVDAGWNAVMVDREASKKHDQVLWMDEHDPSDLDTAFARSKAIGFSSLAKLAPWLPQTR